MIIPRISGKYDGQAPSTLIADRQRQNSVGEQVPCINQLAHLVNSSASRAREPASCHTGIAVNGWPNFCRWLSGLA
jgi:hypothetical protein